MVILNILNRTRWGGAAGRSLRSMRSLQRSGRGLARVASLATAAGVGAGLMYALDPVAGGRRRALAYDKSQRAWRQTTDLLGKAGRDFRHRSLGLVAETRAHLRREDVSDELLIERVRARLGHLTEHANAIGVGVKNGCVTLSGPVLTQDQHAIVRGVSRVPGVRALIDGLDVHTHADVATLQHEPRPPRHNAAWSPLQRVALSGLGTLVLYGLFRRGWLGLTIGALGGAVVLQAMRDTANVP
jgi:hypothetical protein